MAEKVDIDPERPLVKSTRRSLDVALAAGLATAAEDITAYVVNALARFGKADLTDEELAAQIADEVNLDGLKILIDPTAAHLARVATDSAISVIAQIGEPVPQDSFNQVNNPAVEFAQQRAAELVGMKRLDDGTIVPNPNAKMTITDSTRNMIHDTIVSGLKDNTGNMAIAKEIEELGFGKVRAKLISFTEISRANSEGSLAGYKAAEAAGVAMKKGWSTAMDDDVDEMICLHNQEAGPIPLDKPFPSGHQTTPGHPRCRCRIVGVVG